MYRCITTTALVCMFMSYNANCSNKGEATIAEVFTSNTSCKHQREVTLLSPISPTETTSALIYLYKLQLQPTLTLWESIHIYNPNCSHMKYGSRRRVWPTSSPKGNDRSPESNVPRSNLISKNIYMGHGNQRPEIEHVRVFMTVLVTSNFDEDSIKNEWASMETTIFPL